MASNENKPKFFNISTVSGSTNLEMHSSSSGSNCQQTIPKIIPQLPNLETSAQINAPSNTNRRRSSANNNSAQQVVNSLIARKRLTSYITVEPLAFLAILSLYIEFPSIQDLIYTKTCLQVISKHAQPNENSTSGFNSPTLQQVGLTAIGQNVTPALLILPNNGRIQSFNESRPIPTIDTASMTYLNTTNFHLICDRLNKSAVPDAVQHEIIDIDSKFWLTYQIIVCSLCVLASPQWGGISDRIGRVLPMNVPILSSAFVNLISLIFGLLISFDSHALLRLEWLYLGAILVGISGGQGVVIANAVSYVSDNTANESRSKRITVLESVVFVAQSCGYLISKFISRLGLAPPNKPWLNRHFVAFSTCVLLNIVCIIYSLIRLRHRKFHRFMNNFEREQQEATMIGDSMCSLNQTTSWDRVARVTGQNPNDKLPELSSTSLDEVEATNSLDRPDPSYWTIFTLAHYKETFLSAAKPREARSIILLILLATFMSALSLATLLSLLYVYLRSDPFNWLTSRYSSWNSLNSITRSIALIGLTLCMKFVKGWNVPDPLVAMLGFLSKGAGLLMIGLAHSSTLVEWSILAFVFSEYSLPPLRSLLSKLVLKDERAKIFSCMSALQNLCFLFGNIIFYMTYTSIRIVGFFRMAFITVAALEFFTVVLMLVVHVSLRQRVLIV